MQNIQNTPAVLEGFASAVALEEHAQTDAIEKLLDRQDCTGEDIERFLKETAAALFSESVEFLLQGLYDKTKSLPRMVVALDGVRAQIPDFGTSDIAVSLGDYFAGNELQDAVLSTPPKEIVDTIVALMKSAVECKDEDRGWPIIWASELLDEIKFDMGSDAEAMQVILMAAFESFSSKHSVVTINENELLFGAKQLQHIVANN